MAIKVVTDSTANIADEVLKELDIKQVSLSVNFPDVTYKEIEVSQEVFYKKLAESPKIPTSAQPSPTDFYNVFKEIVTEGHDIIGIFISTGLSGTYNSALIAKQKINEEFPKSKIEIMDSRTTIMAMGYSVIEAAKAARMGQTMESILPLVERACTNSCLYFVPKTLEYLNKGGRINDAAALIGTLLKVKPILTVRERKVKVHAKVRTFEKALLKILIDLENNLQSKNISEVTVHHINNYDEAQYFMDKIKRKTNVPVIIRPISPVIGLHVGPGTIGIAYIHE